MIVSNSTPESDCEASRRHRTSHNQAQNFVNIMQTLQQRDIDLQIISGNFSEIKPHGWESAVMLEVCLIFANLEHKCVSRRTKKSLEELKLRGEILGRRSKFEQWKPKLIEMKTMGYSQGEMSRSTGLAYNTVKTYLKRITLENNL